MGAGQGTLHDLRDTMANSLVIVSACIEEQLHREGVEVRRRDKHRLVEMVIIDEAERMPTSALELVRDIFDRTGMGLILIGMPGMEKRLSRALPAALQPRRLRPPLPPAAG